MIEKTNLAEKFSSFDDLWKPKIVGQVNEFHVKLVKFKGEFVWHHHETEDEMFLITKGTMLLRLRDREIEVGEGEFIIIPHGVEHMPVTREEAHALLFEPKTTLNTGNVRGDRTVTDPERI